MCALAPKGLDISLVVADLARRMENWDEFLASVELNQLRPQAAVRLTAPSVSKAVPAPILTRLADGTEAHRGRARFMSAELVRVLDALRVSGVRAVALKGPAFAVFCGAGMESRELTDLDVLILPGDIERSVEALCSIGYQCPLPPQAVRSTWLSASTWELPLVHRRSGVLLELHWRLAPPWFPTPVSAENVLATAERREFIGSDIGWPRADELFLIHAADGMKSGGVGVRWLSDLGLLVRGLDVDWARVVDIADRHGGLNIVRVALAVVESLHSMAASVFRLPGLTIDLPAIARRLSEEARATRRLTRAVAAIRERLQMDRRITGAVAHFRWSLQIADRPLAVAAAITRYVSGPTIADLARMPPGGLGAIPLRFRALRRRLGAGARGGVR